MFKRTTLKNLDKKKIYKFLELLKQKNIKISRVILFGSFVKSKASVDSDIDIAIVSPQFGIDVTGEMMFLRKVAIQIDSRIEPLPFSPEDFNNPYSTLIQEIKRSGRDLL